MMAEMSSVGVAVPPGFTIDSTQCARYLLSKSLDPSILASVRAGIELLEDDLGYTFGSTTSCPLLVEVRTSAGNSVPGIADTIPFIGLNDKTVEALAAAMGNARPAYRTYRRFLELFGERVLKVPRAAFEKELEAVKAAKGVLLDTAFDEAALRELCDRYKAAIQAASGMVFPSDPMTQLIMAIEGGFKSWESPKAVKARAQRRELRSLPGCAVTVQANIMGTVGDVSAFGVLFTRNPASGDNAYYGEYLPNGDAEDMDEGVREHVAIAQLQSAHPAVFAELQRNCTLLEKHYKDMMDVQFAVQDGRLFVNRVKTGKRTGSAAIRIALDMVEQGIVSIPKAIAMVQPGHLDQLLHPQFEDEQAYQQAVVGKGVPASPGAAAGQVAFSTREAEALYSQGIPCILVQRETSQEDIGGIYAAEAVLTAAGGMASHAAVVARGWGKPCVCSCARMTVDVAHKVCKIGGAEIKEGDWISINGATGEVILGKQPLRLPQMSEDLTKFMSWSVNEFPDLFCARASSILTQISRYFCTIKLLSAPSHNNAIITIRYSRVDKYRRLKVFANADSPEDAVIARENGCEGIGLVRTETLLFSKPTRLKIFRHYILAATAEEKKKRLHELKEAQREDFERLFRVMNGLPVTIRLLDPPLQEFLPALGDKAGIKALSAEVGVPTEAVGETIARLSEVNPMLGFRGVRLGVVYPDLTDCQVRAIVEAAIVVGREGITCRPEIMLPLVNSAEEVRDQEAVVRRAASAVMHDFDAGARASNGNGNGNGSAAHAPSDVGTSFAGTPFGPPVNVRVGTMIEVPRACLVADQIAEVSAFCSLGTNDLTQMTLGFSRDDTNKFVPHYIKSGMIKRDPFQSIDVDGVGQLLMMAIEKGRAVNPTLEVGICGEHGGDPKSIEFFHKIGCSYVSCSPFRVPIARLAAAHAAIRSGKSE